MKILPDEFVVLNARSVWHVPSNTVFYVGRYSNPGQLGRLRVRPAINSAEERQLVEQLTPTASALIREQARMRTRQPAG